MAMRTASSQFGEIPGSGITIWSSSTRIGDGRSRIQDIATEVGRTIWSSRCQESSSILQVLARRLRVIIAVRLRQS